MLCVLVNEVMYCSNDCALLNYLVLFVTGVESDYYCNDWAPFYYLKLRETFNEVSYCCSDCALCNIYS